MIKPCECETFIMDCHDPQMEATYYLVTKHLETNIFSDRFYCDLSNLKNTRKKAFKNLQQKLKEASKK